MSAHAFTLYDMLVRNALLYGDRPAVLHAEGCLTFRAFLERVNALSAGLAALPLVKGERLAVLAQNHAAYLELYGACARLGVIAYPINWRLTSDEIQRIVARAAPRLLLVDDSTVALVADWPQTHPEVAHWYTLGRTETPGFTAWEHLYTPAGSCPAVPVTPDEPFAVISTAAVDVIPRGAVLTHTNMLLANLQTMLALSLNEHDVNLLALPLFHIAALGSALATMHAGGANVIMTRFEAQEAVTLIEQHGVTSFISFPPVLAQILDVAAQTGSRLASLKHVMGLENPDTITRLHTSTTAQFWTGFGQTETSGFITLQRVADRPGSAGRVVPLCQMRLVDDNDREVPVGTPGEILVRGPLVFQGYYDQPDVTAQTLRGGWHHTGDVGRLDAEGYLYYVQRKPEKALIKPGGENVYPAEVETVILELAGVTGVCVFGVPDAHWGEAVKAVVEVAPAQTLNAAQVRDYVGSRIARYKRPQAIEFTDALPRNTAGMIDRAAVQERWGES